MQLYERLDFFVRWLLIGLIGLVPFFAIPLPWVGIIQAKMALVAVILLISLLLWTIARFAEGAVRLPSSLIFLAALFIPLAYAISSAVNGFHQLSVLGTGADADTLSIVVIMFSALVLYATAFAGQSGGIVSALRALFVGTFVLYMLEIFHFALPQFLFGGVFASLAANPFGSWGQLAMFSGLILILSLALTYSGVGRGWWRYVLYASAVVSFAQLVLAGVFDVWALVCAALITFLVLRGYKSGNMRSGDFWRAHALPALIAVVALFFMVFGSLVLNVLPERIKPTLVDVRPSWQGTLSVGQQSLAAPLPLLFGSGPNTFTREWGQHKPVQVNQTLFWNTDFNTGVASIPTSLITTGLLGVLSWILLMCIALFSIARLWLAQSHSVLDALSIAALYLLALQALSVPGGVLAIFTFALLGLMFASVTPQFFALREMRFWGDMRGYGSALGTLLFVGAGGAAVLGTLLVVAAEMQVNRGIVMYNATNDAARASVLISRAIELYPSDRAHRAAVELGLLQLRALSGKTGADQEAARTQLQATLEATIQHGLSAVSIDGGAYQNWLGLAGLYAELAGANVEGAYDNARNAFERAAVENPTSPLPYVNLARLELLQKNPDQALIQLEKAVQLKSDLAVAYFLASQAYVAKNDLENAMRSAARAVESAQADPQAWYNYGVIAYTAKKYPESAFALEQAVARQERFANALYVLGLAYYELQRTPDAIKTFETLSQLDPEAANVQTILANLRSGQPPIPPAAGATSTPARSVQ